MRCDDCFVSFGKLKISFKETQPPIDFFVSSPGKEKLLYIYGGEPLLDLKLLKRISNYYFTIAAKAKKKSDLIVVTNGTILNEEILEFLKKHSIKIMVSLSGNNIRHNRRRKFINGRDSFETIGKNIKKLFNNLPQENMWVSHTFYPDMCKFMVEDLLFYIKLGFRNIHLEPIQFSPRVYWNQKTMRTLTKQLTKFLLFSFNQILQNRFIYNSLSLRFLEEIEEKAPKRNTLPYLICNDIKIWPKRRYGFSNFEAKQKYSNERGKKRYENNLNDLLKISHLRENREKYVYNNELPQWSREGSKPWGVLAKLIYLFTINIHRCALKHDIAKQYIMAARKITI